MNKPRLLKVCGVWYCGVLEHATKKTIGRVGLGFTKELAYLDWYRHQAKAL